MGNGEWEEGGEGGGIEGAHSEVSPLIGNYGIQSVSQSFSHADKDSEHTHLPLDKEGPQVAC